MRTSRYLHDDIGLLISDVDPSRRWDRDERIYLRDFIVRNEMFSVEHFSRLSGCGAAVKEAKTVGGGDTQSVLILGTHKLRWHVHRHDG